jgi:hypothetical protein
MIAERKTLNRKRNFYKKLSSRIVLIAIIWTLLWSFYMTKQDLAVNQIEKTQK